MGNGSSYTVTTHTTVTTNTIASQTTIHITSTVQMSEETKFFEIGMNSDNEYIKGSYNGKNFSIAVTRSDTVGDIIGALADYGINASVRGGKIYINESENAYITSFQMALKTHLLLVHPAEAVLHILLRQLKPMQILLRQIMYLER